MTLQSWMFVMPHKNIVYRLISSTMYCKPMADSSAMSVELGDQLKGPGGQVV